MKQTCLQFQLVAAAGLSSRAIGWFGGGFYTHVDIVWPDGRLFGARSETMVVNGLTYDEGVQFRPQGYAKWCKVTRIDVPCNLNQRNRALEWALRQEWKHYDRRAILGLAVGRDWRDENQWFCSELASRYLEVAFDFRLALHPNKVNPGGFAIAASTARGLQMPALREELAA